MSISLPNGTLLATPAQQTQYTAAVTRILHLSNFPAELKTRDLQVMFKDYENDKGGFRIKWVDDTNALVVFADAGVAKRAYLSHLLSPPSSFPPPAQIAPYTKPDAAQIIQSLAARAMGHRSSMSNYSQQVQLPLGAIPLNGVGGLDGLPNGTNGYALGSQAPGLASHIRAGSVNKGNAGPGGWTFPAAAAPNRSGSTGATGSTGPPAATGMPGSSMGPPPVPIQSGVGIGRHGRTGSASFSRSAMGSIGGGGGGISGALSFGVGAGAAASGGAGVAGGGRAQTGGLPTHTESLDSPAIPAGFSTARQEGVGGGSSRRLTGRHGGAGSLMGGNSSNIGANSGAGAGLGFGAGAGTGAMSFGSGNGIGAGRASTSTIAERPDSRRSIRSAESSDTEPIVVMHEPTPRVGASGSDTGNTIDGRGKVPFGQWKMPSSASPTGSGSAQGHSTSVSPGPGGGASVSVSSTGPGVRRDSVSADKALREVEKALRGVEAQG